MTFFLTLAVFSSLFMALGLLMMKSCAAALPAAHGIGIPRAVLAWIREPRWIGGLGLETAGYALYVVAVSGAPVSIAAVMMQGGIGLFVLFSVVFLGERARAKEWAGIVAIVLATLFLTLSLSAGAPHSATHGRTLVALSAALAVIAAAPFAVGRLSQNGAAQAIASGVAFGAGELYTKAMALAFLNHAGAPLLARSAENPWVYAVIAANVAGVVMLQNSFRQARGITVMPLSSALSNVVPILGGILAFGEHLPAAPAAAAMRVGAFVLTIAAGATLAVVPEPTGDAGAGGVPYQVRAQPETK
jgi:drug/metabolite transporter (DMT)-like permease